MKKFLHKIMEYLSTIQKIFLIVAAILLIAFFFPEKKYTEYQFKEGSFWKYDDLVAPFNFAILKSDETLKKEYDEVRKNYTLFYNENAEVPNNSKSEYKVLFEKEYSFNINRDEYTEKLFFKKSLSWLDELYKRGIVNETTFDGEKPALNQSVIVLRKGHAEQKNLNEFYTLDDAKRFIRAKLKGLSFLDSTFIERQLSLVLHPNYILDKERTEQEINQRIENVSKTSGMVSAGDLIISRGEHITPEKYLMLLSFEKENINKFGVNFSATNHFIGKLSLLILAFLGLFLFLKLVRHPILESTKAITLILMIILSMVFVTALIYSLNENLILLAPLCLGPIIIRVFFDSRTALCIHVITIFVIGFLIPNGFEFMYYQLFAGIFAIVSLKNIQKRASFFQASLVIFVIYSVVYISKTLMEDTHFRSLEFIPFFIFLLNAFITMLAYPLIYMIEKLFGLVSEVTLLELSSTNTPALRDLATKAPGTFQHTVQVANIAEDLINEIGGNAMLTRVGALYHDIGKMNSPMYFVENQLTDFNPHDELTYEESAAIILSHVPEGVQLAHKYNLPEIIIDFIRTHHGTTKTGYFYAMQKKTYPDQPINDEDYTYKGPKPYSKETAVVMLVDSVEAATKSMKTHTEQAMDEMIENVIELKIKDGQLSNCDMTFRDVDKIKQFLKKKMRSVYHVRIEYPVDKE